MKSKAEEGKTSSFIKFDFSEGVEIPSLNSTLMGFDGWKKEPESKGFAKVEAEFDAGKMDYEDIVLKPEVKADSDGELEPVDQKVANKSTKIEDDFDIKSTSTSIQSQVKIDITFSLPLNSIAEDDDIDVNDLQFNLGDPSINDDDPMNIDHPVDEGGAMEVDQVEQPDIGHPFEAEVLETPQIIVKKELRDDRLLLDSQPVKQQRLEFDGILLPSPAEVRRRWALEVHPAPTNSLEEIEEMNIKVESWSHPTMKKQEGLVMNLGVTSRRLIAAGVDFLEIDLEDDLRDIEVSRKFMAMRFGGSSQDTIPTISQDNFNRHGFQNFIYFNTDAQVMAPEIPGAAGLFFSPNHVNDFTGVNYKLFTKIKRTPKALWTYLGEYKAIKSQSLSKAEWNEQTSSVKSAWARMILKKSWGSSVRVRVFARKKFKCRNPTKEQLGKVLAKEEKKRAVTADEIRKALDCGDEVLHTWVVKCIGFDKSLQRQIIEELKSWIEPPPRKKGPNDQDGDEED